MKKRITAIVISILMVASMLPFSVFAETTHVHSLECPGEGNVHNKDNCPDYALAEGEPVVEPGCCTPGYTLYKCNDCGEYFASDIVMPTEADDCTWESVSDFVAPTCTTDGAWAKFECTVGDAVKYTDADGNIVDPTSNEAKKAIEELGHDFGDLLDCHEGLVCRREDCDFSKAAGDHTWEGEDIADSEIVIDEPSTLYKDGKFHYECGVCGAKSPTYVIHAHEHDLVPNQGKGETCTAAGVKAHYTCSVEGCEMIFVDANGEKEAVTAADLVIEPHAHTYKDLADTAYNTFIDNTCKTTGYTLRKCTECKLWYEENLTPVDPEKHTWAVIEPAVPGDCENEGKTALEYCKVCRVAMRGGEVIEGTDKGHNEVTVTVNSTCTKRGYTYTYCTNSFCTVKESDLRVNNELVAEDLKILESEIFDLDPDTHTMGWVVTEEPTCIAPGHKVWACTSCEAENTGTGVYEAIPVDTVNGHNWKKDSNATCTEAEKWHCTLCQSKDYAQAAPANGHKTTDWHGNETQIFTVPAKCNADGTGTNGYTYRKCQVWGCNAEVIISTIEYNPTFIYEDEDEARSQHTFVRPTKVVYQEGDCDKLGLWTLGDCTRCRRNILLVMEGTGEGHKAPAGWVDGADCVTGDSYECQNEWCDETITTPELGHQLNEVAKEDPTCTEPGWEAYSECSRCHEKFVGDVEKDPALPALGHLDCEPLTNTADCDEFGYRIEYCLRCDSHDMYDYVAELGHDMTEESVYTDCLTDKRFECQRDDCDHFVVDEGTAPGHTDKDGNKVVEGCLSTNKDVANCAKCGHAMNYDHALYVQIDDAAPTCTQPGYDLVACEVCDFEQIIVNEDPLGHNMVKDGKCKDKSTEPSFTAGGSYHYCCSRCDLCEDVAKDILTGVGFDLSIENAVFEDADVVDSTIIAVNVSMKSLKIDIWGYQFDVDYDANNLTYLGYTYNNADFNIHKVNDNGDYVTVLGYVENTPEGEKQNVTVETSTDIITLYFQVNVDDKDTTANFVIDNEYIDVRNADEDVVNSVGDSAAVEIGIFADANGDDWATVADVQYAYYIATGLYEDNTYDSCVDINKDGWITAADVRLLADLATGAADYEDLFEADEWERPEGFVSAA